MWVLGVTGGIGSGKSLVAEQLRSLGAGIVDADLGARLAVAPGQPVLHAIAERFGSDMILPDGSLNRRQLRALIFDDPEARQWLEAQIHPWVYRWIEEQLHILTTPYAVLVSPLLFESGQAALTDKALVVDAREDLQIQRTCSRDQSPETQVRQIMAAQLPRAERLAKADYVVDNSGTPEQTFAQVAQLHPQFLKLAEHKPREI